jgi:hypothetical protein
MIDISSFKGAQLSRYLLLHLHLRTETDPVSETSCSLEYQTMEKVQKKTVILRIILNKKFWEEIIVYFPWIRNEPHRKPNKGKGVHTGGKLMP